MRKRVREDDAPALPADQSTVEKALFMAPVLAVLNPYLDFKTIWRLAQVNRRFYYKWLTKKRLDVLKMHERLQKMCKFSCREGWNPVLQFRAMVQESLKPLGAGEKGFNCWRCRKRRIAERLANRQVFKQKTCIQCAQRVFGLKSPLRRTNSAYQYHGYCLDAAVYKIEPNARKTIRKFRAKKRGISIFENPGMKTSLKKRETLYAMNDFYAEGIAIYLLRYHE